MARASHNVGEEPDGHPAKRESCASPSRACAREMRGNSKLSDLKEKARLATLEANRGQVKTAQQANSQSTGYDLGSTYYVWDGDPREIPTPRHRQGGGFNSVSGGGVGTARPTVRRSLQSRMAAARGGGTISLPAAVPGATNSTNLPRPSAQAKDLPKYWDGIDYSDYCANANSVERGSALYGYLCIPDPLAYASQDQDNYQPFPDPKDLDRKVSQICELSYSRDTRQCFFENKLRIVLDNNPDVRDACAEKLGAGSSLRDELAKRLGGGDDGQGDPNANAYTRCVDDAYLHGLHPKSTVGLREELKRKLEDKSECPDITASNQKDVGDRALSLRTMLPRPRTTA